MTERYLDLDAWPRRRHFQFFRAYERPFFNLCAPVEVAGLTARARRDGQSFFLLTLHSILRAVNEREPFRYRLNKALKR